MLKIRQCRKIRAPKRFNLDFIKKIKMNSKKGFLPQKTNVLLQTCWCNTLKANLLLQFSLKTDKKLMAQYLMKMIGEKKFVTLDSWVQAKLLLLTMKTVRDP